MGTKEKNLPPGYKAGKIRPFFSTRIAPLTIARTTINKVDHLYLFGLFALAFIVRFYKLPEPPKVVFDETHFGSFAKEYYDGEFFVDVHPPLGKLMFYWVALLFKWDGKFEFLNVADVFDDAVPYIAMRSVSAACGVLTILLTYGILRASSCRPLVALFGSLLVLVENSLATQSRLIMLDSPLIAFTALTIYSYKRFEISPPFGLNWFKFLFLTGVSLGLMTSVKLTGLFTYAWVGALTLYQLWCYSGDLEVSALKLVFHVVSRAFALFVVPLTIYCGFFSVHFSALTKNGTGSGAMTPSFRAGFTDSGHLLLTAAEISYGSTVTLKHNRLQMYLHSHDFKYRSGTGEQQVTMYGFDGDGNNEWVMETTGTNYDGKFDTKFRPIKDGATVKLYHRITKTYLRANDVRPPNSEHDYSNEVSCKGNRTDTEDKNYEWRVKIIRKQRHSENDLPLRKLRATESVFQLIHRGTGCILMSHDTKLPDWGFNQNQVLCVNDPTLENTLWYAEMNLHPLINNDKEKYPRVKLATLLFFDKLLEYHQAMVRINKSFTTEHKYASLPFTWPIASRGISYFSNGHGGEKLTDETGSHIYFLANIAVYFSGLFVVLTFAVKAGVYIINHLNPFALPHDAAYVDTYYVTTAEYVFGWLINYVPYFYMSRQLFAHHYLPSVFFLVLVISQYLEYQMAIRPAVGYAFMAVVLLGAVYCFVALSPLVYGLAWTLQKCQRAKWFSTWDLDCMAYSQ